MGGSGGLPQVLSTTWIESRGFGGRVLLLALPPPLFIQLCGRSPTASLSSELLRRPRFWLPFAPFMSTLIILSPLNTRGKHGLAGTSP